MLPGSFVSRLALLCSLASALAGCGDDGAPAPLPDAVSPGDAGRQDAGPVDAGPFMPDLVCPGAPGCMPGGSAELQVGAAMADITPVIDASTEIQLVDTNGNGEFNPEDGDTFRDVDGDGVFDGIWIAGFGSPRSANGVENPQWARAVALRRADTTLVLVSLDAVGYFYDEILAVRDMLPASAGIDFLTVGATHSHEARDTMGQWGPSLAETGTDEAYMARIRAQIVRAAVDAVAALAPAHVQYASTSLRDQPGGMLHWVGDNRDPFIVDDEMRLLRFTRADDARTIATVVNFGAHAEYSGDSNQKLSSDWPHWLRDGIENGALGPDGAMEPGVGGIALLFQSAIGMQIGPNHYHPAAWDGTVLPRESTETARTVGQQLAWIVLRALGPTGGSTTEDTADLAVRSKRFLVDVENVAFHIGILFRVFYPRATFNWDEERTIVPGVNEPDLQTEVAIIDVGKVQMIAVPGELDPSLFLGGYDGSYTPPGLPVVDTSGANPNPPDLTRAPAAPYLRDLARPDAESVWLCGLTGDEIGYFVPEFDYQLDARMPYIDEAPGDHYEETNSIGVHGWPRVRENLEELLRWHP